MRRKLMVFIMAVLLFLSCVVSVSATAFDAGQKGSITLKLTKSRGKDPVVGAEFDVYYVATVCINEKKKLSYGYTETFMKCGFPLDSRDLTKKLDKYVAENTITATRIRTDEKGVAKCENLPLGMYFVKQVNQIEGFSVCSPFLVTVPKQEGSRYIYNVDAFPKTDIYKLLTITVKKEWDAGKNTIPTSVKVQLLQNSKVIETATLSKDNNWQVTYNDMPMDCDYDINEINVPSGFTPDYDHSYNASDDKLVLTVTNVGTLAQTGQLIWPIPVLATAGLFFLLTGFVILRKSEKHHA